MSDTQNLNPDNLPSVPYGEDFPEIRRSIQAICKDFPGEYWRDQESKKEHAAEFTKAMTESGYLSALIPEEYGGAGLPLRAGGGSECQLAQTICLCK